jgi:hypothetical protein
VLDALVAPMAVTINRLMRLLLKLSIYVSDKLVVSFDDLAKRLVVDSWHG